MSDKVDNGASPRASEQTRALVSHVEPTSIAYEAGIRAGDIVVAVNDEPLRDILDWRWKSADEEVAIRFECHDGDVHDVTLVREGFEDWGIEFEGAIFDKVKTCRNACKFCFMRQLPSGLRESLSMRDDDFRMSFLDGTFITLTNLDDDDIDRIIEQRITPLRVSLHAVDPDVRESLIGKHAAIGLRNLEALLDAGIEFDAQIVLVPGMNDGAILDETLDWAFSRPGIRTVGIVPLGFTRFQRDFDRSFDDPAASKRVLDQVGRFQERAMEERGEPWAYAADEFYRNAYGKELLDNLPPSEFYGDFSMYQDGIGIIRSAVEDFRTAEEEGYISTCAQALADSGKRVRYICGYAMDPQFAQLLEQSELNGMIAPLLVANDFFGGNVNVTGLLAGCDIANAIAKSAETDPPETIYAIPSIVFNADRVTLDDMSIDDIKSALSTSVAERVFVVAGNPLDYIKQLGELAEGQAASE